VKIGGLLALGAVLLLPFVLRPKDNLIEGGGERVIVITPHNEAIRHEFGRAFREHVKAQTGRSVYVDWRTPGGSSEIMRYLASEYAASGERTSGADVLFGGGSHDFVVHASAGRLVDAGIVGAHPELFNDRVIPEKLGGQTLWDRGGRWIGTCLSGFGICYNRDSIARLRLKQPPSTWADLANPVYFGQIALADPTKSGSAVKAFEMIIQQQMNVRRAALIAQQADHNTPLEVAGPGAERAVAGGGAELASADELAVSEGWDHAMLLIRQIAGNARYFTDAASKIPLEVASGDAAAGMCIDFYGRFQSEVSQGGTPRAGFASPAGGTSMDADPIGMLRGAPSPSLAREFMEFVLSPEGQKLWNFRVGTPDGPDRYALRRLPILPTLYAPEYAASRSDPEVNPYDEARSFVYHEQWTGPLFRTIAFVVRVMCVDTEEELSAAWHALIAGGFPSEATARFADSSLVAYDTAVKTITTTLKAADPIAEVKLGNELVLGFRALYREVADLARAGR
jgi:ABC-type Fe3+ transport system substrate-binding protein